MSGHDDDEALLARIAANDSAAIRTMVDRKLARMLGFATRLLGDRSEAEDVTQEAFLRIWKQAPGWQSGIARFDTWLHRIVLNLCYDRLRKRRETYVALVPETADPGDTPEQAMAAGDMAKTVETAIAALPDRQREAIVLQYYQELSNIEAASVMNISIEALESLLSRARRNLRAGLKPDELGRSS